MLSVRSVPWWLVVTIAALARSSAPAEEGAAPWQDRRLCTLNEGETPCYETLGADGRFFAFSLQVGGGRVRLGLNDERTEPVHTDNLMVQLTTDGRLVYVTRDGSRERVHIGEWQSEAWDFISDPVLSPDGLKVAFVAETGGSKTLFVGPDPVAQGFDWIAAPTFDRSGRLAFSAARGKEYFVVVEGKEGPAFVDVRAAVFSPDGTRVAYQALEGKNRWVVVGDERYDTEVGTKLPFFSPDGRHVAWKVEQEGKQLYYVDGEKGPESPYADCAEFSPDGTRFAHHATSGDGLCIVVDGVVLKTDFADCGRPFFAPDGRLGYLAHGVAEEDSEGMGGYDVNHLILDGKVLHTSEGFGAVVFGPDGDTIAFEMMEADGWRIRVGEQEHGPFEKVWGMRFSPDGEYVGFGALKDREVWWRVVRTDSD